MHIVFLSAFSYPDGGAGATRSLAMAQGLVENGHAVTFVLLTQPSRPAGSRYDVFDWLLVPGRETKLWRNALIATVPRMLKALHATRPVAAIMVLNRDSLLLTRAASFSRRLGISSFHELTEFPDILPYRSPRKDAEAILIAHALRRFSGVVAISTSLQRFLIDRGIRRTCLSGPLVDPSERPQAPPALRGCLRIGYAGSLSQAKDGINHLLEAASSARESLRGVRNVHVDILGGQQRSAEMNRAQSKAAELGLSTNVTFHGHVPACDVATRLSLSHVLALPRPASRQAQGGFPTKLGEYLATSRPVITTSVGDIPRYLTHGIDAYMTRPGEPEEFAGALVDVSRNYRHAQEVGARGRVLAETTLSARSQTIRIADFIAEARDPASQWELGSGSRPEDRP